MPDQSATISRPPIVVVLGHVDHGKSTLLDFIRKTNIVDKETGGITQHIAAWEIKHAGKRLTFIDTPGHAAFNAMRKRGAAAADIAVLVVAADDGVKPQTLEALEAIKAMDLPFIVAINKIDKPQANLERTKQTLAEAGVFVEGYGGTVPVAEVSGKTGVGVTLLLDLILLLAELEDHRAAPDGKTGGIVIETHHAGKHGIVATLIIKNGTLRKNEFVATESAFAPIRQISNPTGEALEQASFSTPVEIAGWNAAPGAGESFESFRSKKEAEQAGRPEAREEIAKRTKKEVMVPVLLKADSLGTLEAVLAELKKRESEQVGIVIVGRGIGDFTEGDIKLIQGAQQPLLIGFGVGVDRYAQDAIDKGAIRLKQFDIIYKLTEWFDQYLTELVPKEELETVTGRAKILKTFSRVRERQIVGGKVLEGELKVGGKARLLRREEKIGEGQLVGLEQDRNATTEVAAGSQFGAKIESKVAIAEGDTLEILEARG